MSTKKTKKKATAPVTKPAKKKSVKPVPKKAPAKIKSSKTSDRKPVKNVSQKTSAPAQKAKTATVEKKTTESVKIETPKSESKSAMNKPQAPVSVPVQKTTPKPKHSKKIIDDDLPLDFEEKEDLLEEEKRDLMKALRDDEDDTLDTAFIPTDTSERYILVVDEEGRRRNETVTIISQILPNAIIEVADDPEEALEIMVDCDFDTYVVNFLMPGYSASPFVKAVANHLDHPLLLGFAADKISDAIDPKKGLKIIPLKRLFDLDTNTGVESTPAEGTEG